MALAKLTRKRSDVRVISSPPFFKDITPTALPYQFVALRDQLAAEYIGIKGRAVGNDAVNRAHHEETGQFLLNGNPRVRHEPTPQLKTANIAWTRIIRQFQFSRTATSESRLSLASPQRRPFRPAPRGCGRRIPTSILQCFIRRSNPAPDRFAECRFAYAHGR